MIDFDLLHREKDGRGTGRTFDALVSAIQSLDFNDTAAFVVEWLSDCAEIRLRMPEICRDLGFDNIRYNRSHSCWHIDGKRLFVIPFSEQSRLSGLDCPVFMDHKISERPTKSFSFSFEVTGEASDVIERLEGHYHRLSDATIHIRNGIPMVSFDRNACSLLEALESAEYDVGQAGCTVAKVILTEYRDRGDRSVG